MVKRLLLKITNATNAAVNTHLEWISPGADVG